MPAVPSGGQAPPALVWWQGEPDAAAPGWVELQRLEGGAIGVLLPAAGGVPSDRAISVLAPYDDPELFYLVAPSQYAALERGELPTAWANALSAQDPLVMDDARALRSAAASIPALARDRAQVLVRIPASWRAIAAEPGGRCRRLRTPSEAAAARAASAAKAARWQQAGIDPQAPSPPDPLRTQPPEFWQSLVQATDADHLFADLGYLSTTLQTRYAYTTQMEAACQYVYDEFSALGLTTSFDNFTYNGHPLKNVLGIKLGTVDPSRIYIIEGHLDSTSPDPQHLAPGADDNGTGAVAVLEAARLLAGLPSDYTIYFLCVTAEEQGLIGSEHFAAAAQQQGLDLRAVLDFDMVGWYDPSGADLWIEGFHQGVSSVWLMNQVQDNAQTYAGLSVYQYPGEGWGSDHEPFHDHGFVAMLSIENEWDSYPCYHRTCDTVGNLTGSFWRKIVAANAITLGQLAQTQGSLGGIDGTVTVIGGDPDGAILHLEGTTYPDQVSDAAGHFSWLSVFPGTYRLTAEMEGFDPITAEVIVPSGGTASVEIVFDPDQPGVVRGVVRGPGGDPIAGARVEVEGQAVYAVSRLDGTYELAPVLPGLLNLSASHYAMVPRGGSVVLAPGQTLSGIDLTLRPTWDFESSPEGLLPSSGWQYGTDAVAGAHSGTHLWGTVLGGDYAGCADYRLDLPPISLRFYQTARLHLWNWYRSQAATDGGNLKVSTDGGASWTVIPPLSGYDGTLAGSCNPLAGESALTGVSGAWVEKVFPLDSVTGRWIRLRLELGSDAATADRGWYIDDLSFEGSFSSASVDRADGTLPGADPSMGPPEGKGPSIRIAPNPGGAGTVRIGLDLGTAQTGELTLYSPSGRRIVSILRPGALGAGSHVFTWDGRDESGRNVPAGTYWVRWQGADGVVTRSVTWLH